MDEPGWHARRRAAAEDRLAYHHRKALEDTQPIDDRTQYPQPVVPVQPISVPATFQDSSAFEEHNYRPPPSVPDSQIPGATNPDEVTQGTQSEPGPAKGTPEAAQLGMNPHLQVMCGPMLRYDTVVNKIWHGFALLVTADTGSDYTVTPELVLTYSTAGLGQLELDQLANDKAKDVRTRTLSATKIYEHHALAGPSSFWRFKLEVPLSETEKPVTYSINRGKINQFYVPGANQEFRWVGHSCNGFSQGVDTESFAGPDPLWNDVLRQHGEKPIHALIGGGDQIYCDSMAREPELQDWIQSKKNKEKAAAPLTEPMRFAIDRYLFNHYTKWFRSGAFGRTIAQIPMVNMLDDHDLIDGFGSYPDELQTSAVFSTIGSRGYFFYLLFQMFICDDFDGTRYGQPHCNKSLILGGEGAYIPFPSHSFLIYLGPTCSMLLLDCRAERKLTQICTSTTYDRVFHAVGNLPSTMKHLVLLLGVPMLYPRMTFAEHIMDSKLNPIGVLARKGVLGLGGMVNKFNGQMELLDDMSDHWTADGHKKERNSLIVTLQEMAVVQKRRFTFLSGDVHLAAIGKLFDKREVPAEKDPKYMVNVISSAIVNTPPPQGLVGLMGRLNKKTHKTLHWHNTSEEMIGLFEYDTDGTTKLKNPYFMGRRNYCIATVQPDSQHLSFDMRIEKTKGNPEGNTTGYVLSIPAPGW